jgi:hypothetical protein
MIHAERMISRLDLEEFARNGFKNGHQKPINRYGKRKSHKAGCLQNGRSIFLLNQ